MTCKLTPAMQRYTVPLSLLLDRQLSVFECVVEYLRESKGLAYRQIALLTNRDERTIWTVYNRAKKKREVSVHGATRHDRSHERDGKDVPLPIGIFHDRKAAVLEAISLYLRDVAGLTYSEIGGLTNRDERTIWTVYNRARKKQDSSSGAEESAEKPGDSPTL